jgi:general secretion pathway protein F
MMASFEYKAATSAGEIVNGVLSGSSRANVIQQLQSLGHIPIRVDESAAPSGGRKIEFQWRKQRVTEQDVADVTRELATLLQAGLPLDRALAILVSLADREPLAEMLGAIRERVKEGATLADAKRLPTRWKSRRACSAASTSACCVPASPAVLSKSSSSDSQTTSRAQKKCAAR